MRYWMSDDDYSDDSYDDQPGDDQEQEDDQPEEEDEAEEDDQEPEEDQGGGGDDDAGDEQPPEIGDEDLFPDPADEFPDATEEDFEDDEGNWTPDDYQASAERLFGNHEFFGDTVFSQRESEGYTHFDNPGFLNAFDSVSPGVTETVSSARSVTICEAFAGSMTEVPANTILGISFTTSVGSREGFGI